MDALFHRVFGRVAAAKLKYWYNRRTLRRLIRVIQPDVVFHADNFYYFPAVDGNHIAVSDTQDDINWAGIGRAYGAHRRKFLYANFRKMARAYIVSEAAKLHLNQSFPSPIPFTVISNGAAFHEIRDVACDEISAARDRHRLNGKFIVSYIGGAAKFDPQFAKRLFGYAEKALPDTHFVIVGNIRPISFPNVTWIGPVSPETAAIYYNLSNVGTILRNCDDDPFIANSVPLKVIQYAAARKPVVGFQVQWAKERQFPNLFELSTSDPVAWCDELDRVRREFNWTDAMDDIWAPYSWDVICKTIADELHSLVLNRQSQSNSELPAANRRSGICQPRVAASDHQAPGMEPICLIENAVR